MSKKSKKAIEKLLKKSNKIEHEVSRRNNAIKVAHSYHEIAEISQGVADEAMYLARMIALHTGDPDDFDRMASKLTYDVLAFLKGDGSGLW